MSDELRLTSRHGNEEYTSALRDEASVEPDPVATGPVKKDTQIIAIYGKGGIGKSFTLANLSCMMAEQGIKLGAGGVQMCLTAEQIKAQEIPLHDPDSGCSNEILERSATLWKFRFNCPDAQGEGETRFVSDKEFTTQVTGAYNGQPSSMESRARWVGADCGVLNSN